MRNSNKSHIGGWIALVLIVLSLLGVVSYVGVSLSGGKNLTKVSDYKPWSEEVVEAAGLLPVLDGGRVKPFSTYANFEMLRYHGSRSMKFESADGKTKITPTEWMLDMLFRPHISVEQPTFRVDNAEVVEAIGLTAKERRDRYSYEALDQHREKLIELAKLAEDKANRDEELDRVERQILDLGTNFRRYEGHILYFQFARSGIELTDGEKNTVIAMSTALQGAETLRNEMKRFQGDFSKMPPRLVQVMSQIEKLANSSKFGLFMLPQDKGEPWHSAGNTIFEVITGGHKNQEQGIEDILQLENLYRAGIGSDDAKFAKEISALAIDMTNRAKLSGVGKRVGLENSYNERNFFLNGLACFTIGFFLLSFMWLAGASRVARWLSWGVWTFSLLGFAYLLGGIVTRGFIMGRYPIGNLFETIPFITGAALSVAMFIEVLTRKRIFLALLPIIGMGGLYFARRFELGEAVDNMDPLVAVLNSNFWLSTHVFTIVSGYGAGIITGIISFAYVLIRVLKLDGGDAKMGRTLTRAAYGCVCFTLFLSLIGTVLGGIWANDSWGRFWGWDPKENGALMIVLWNLFILHARLGGYLREWGLHLAAIFGIAIIIFSWFHVNILGVGLHSYGFAEDSKRALVFQSYYIITGIVVAGFIYSRFEMRSKKQKTVETVDA